MARPLWKGHISFGMVTIPVSLIPGDRPESLSFELLDDRDLSPIGYRKVNKTSGREVPKEHIARGFRLDDGQVVVVTDDDLKKASPERTQTIEIHAFVEREQVPPLYFERPYYLQPIAAGEKGYALLREAMAASGKAGVGSVVLHARQHLTLLFVEGPWIVMNTLRYRSELKNPTELDAPGKTPDQLGIRDKELEMAKRLVEQMVEPWEPEKYHDLYRDELLAAIRKKAESGEAKTTPEAGEAADKGGAKVTDLMTLLKQSVEQSAGGKPRRRPRTA
jgi:DNA end-binding protein Ku